MASRESYEFVITVPAGTPTTAPIITPTVMPVRVIDEIRWRVPAGSLGVMGWRFSMGGVQVVPANFGGWIIANEHSGSWSLEDQPTSGAWDITAYNTGAHPHSIYVTYMCSLIPREFAPAMLINPVALSNYSSQIG